MMTRSQQPAITAFAIGMIGLGILAFVYHDFALVWQPVPESIPGRMILAYATGVLMLLGGVGLLIEGTAKWAIRLLFPYLIVWMLLKVPALCVAPKLEAVWLGFGELAVLMAGGWVLFARLAELPEGSPLGFLCSEKSVMWAQKWFGLWLIPIGLSHIIYVDQTAAYVPAWLPHREMWAYLTGAGQMASGLGVLIGILPRLAAFTEVAQIGLYTLLVWGAAILAAPKTRLPWTAFFISWAIGSGAWAVAQSVGAKKGSNPS
ncbi:MAG TPA: DoxX family protein [Terriglobales bacterium]|jgi:uncharacterized membrane protein